MDTTERTFVPGKCCNSFVTYVKIVTMEKIAHITRLVFPKNLNNLQCKTAWDSWINYRKEIKKPYRSIQSQQRMLRRWARRLPTEFVDAIDYSIAQGYQGIWEDPHRRITPGRIARVEETKQIIDKIMSNCRQKLNKVPMEGS